MTYEELLRYFDIPPWEWPADLGDKLLAVLKDENRSEEDRSLAAELAADYTVINEDLTEALLAILLDQDLSPEFRGKAAISLGVVLATVELEGGFDFPEDVPISEALYQRLVGHLERICRGSEAKELRRRGLEAAVRSPQGWEANFVRAAHAGEDQEWRLSAVFAMRFLKGFDTEIMEALNDPDPQILAEAIRAAANWEVNGAWRKIARILSEKNLPKPVALACIRAVGMLRPNQVERLLDRFSKSRDPDIASAVEAASAGDPLWDLDL